MIKNWSLVIKKIAKTISLRFIETSLLEYNENSHQIRYMTKIKAFLQPYLVVKIIFCIIIIYYAIKQLTRKIHKLKEIIVAFLSLGPQ